MYLAILCDNIRREWNEFNILRNNPEFDQCMDGSKTLTERKYGNNWKMGNYFTLPNHDTVFQLLRNVLEG